MSLGAIARTRVLLAKVKTGVPMAMTNWWKKTVEVEGEITQHLAANEQHVILPWLKTFPKKAMDRAPHYLWPLGTISLIYVCAATAEYYDQAESYSHRF